MNYTIYLPHILGYQGKQTLNLLLFHIGVQDYICCISNRDVNVCLEYTEDPDPPASLDFLELAKNFMENSSEYANLSLPTTIAAALNLYVDLTVYFDEL